LSYGKNCGKYSTLDINYDSDTSGFFEELTECTLQRKLFENMRYTLMKKEGFSPQESTVKSRLMMQCPDIHYIVNFIIRSQDTYIRNMKDCKEESVL
jgi:hypothetical protein